MASTNEDVTILASGRDAGGRMLMVRHLPDRGTIELGWWSIEDGAPVPKPPVLEIAAERVEFQALRSLIDGLADSDIAGRGPGEELAATPAVEGGARLVASVGQGGVRLQRQPDLGDAVELPVEFLQNLSQELLPRAAERLDELGFGLAQHQQA